MNNKQPNRRASTRRELTASFVAPVVIFLIIWLAGQIVYMTAPGYFLTAVNLLIALGLFLFLLYYTRRARLAARLTAVILAVPALLGVSLSLTRGETPPLVLGVSVTFLLLLIQRFLETPLSYRRAYRAFAEGEIELALEMVNRAIALRPDFGESFQLRALIHLADGELIPAMQDAQMALIQDPEQPTAHNILGQIQLAQGEYEAAATSFDAALAVDPDNALYHYYFGLCQYRLARYQMAAEALHTAVNRNLPRDDFNLLALYYLGRSLSELDRAAEADERFKQMTHFSDSLAELQTQYDHLPAYPHLEQMKLDLTAVQERLTMALNDERRTTNDERRTTNDERPTTND
jgi:tetratricopeptide (TPR) repeat protein